MSGFAGFVTDGSNGFAEAGFDPVAVISSMTDTIAHRGPGDAAYHVDTNAGVALGYRRLLTSDTASGVRLFTNETERAVMAFDGVIYNADELRAELEAAGHVFTTRTDAEVAVRGWEESGSACLPRIRGAFSLVIWDGEKNELFGARDVFSVKPFYYYEGAGSFLFASEIKAFLEHPAFDKRFNPELLSDWLCYEYIPSEDTFFEGVKTLLGGHCFTWSGGTLTIEEFERLTYDIDEGPSRTEWVDRIAATMTDSVRAHMDTDTPIGSLLSSGIDSSYVVAEAREVDPELKTFSVGYTDERYSELSYAKEFAETMGVENITRIVSAQEYFDAAGEVQYLQDEPMPNPSAVSLYYLFQNVSNHTNVVLSGEGADEFFAGYPHYQAGAVMGRYVDRVPKPLRSIAAAAARVFPLKGRNFLMRGGLEPYQRYARVEKVFTREEAKRLLKDGGNGKDPARFVKPYFDRVSDLDETAQLQYADLHIWVPYDINLKADRMSMAHGVELRTPILDRRIWEIARQLPLEHRLEGNTSKVAIREAAARKIPDKTAQKKKLGFPTPLAAWMREDEFYTRIRTMFESEAAGELFDQDVILALLDEHKNGAENMKKVWAIYVFLLWYEEFFIKR